MPNTLRVVCNRREITCRSLIERYRRQVGTVASVHTPASRRPRWWHSVFSFRQRSGERTVEYFNVLPWYLLEWTWKE